MMSLKICIGEICGFYTLFKITLLDVTVLGLFQGFLSMCNPVAVLEQVDELMNTGELAGIPSQVRCDFPSQNVPNCILIHLNILAFLAI